MTNINNIRIAFFAILTILCVGCSDDVSTIGSALVTDKSEIIIDSTFVVKGESVTADSIQSRTLTQLIGRLDASGFGKLSSDVVTQFMSATTIDTLGIRSNDDIKKMEMLMFFDAGAFTGDSLTPMGIKIYPLTKQLPTSIYSNFNASDYYNASDCWGTKIYTGNALQSDSLNKLSYRTISFEFPRSFAVKFYNEYITHPSTFSTPQNFAKFFPGLYIQNSFGNGRITNIKETRVNLHYQRHQTLSDDNGERDTVYNISKTYLAVTPEVVTNNIIKFEMSNDIKAMVDTGENILVAPVGYDVEIEFPLLDVLNKYREQAGGLSVINTLTFSIPAEEVENDYGIEPPTNILMILKKDKKDFFANNELTNNKTSFLAVYNSAQKSYDFSSMRGYLLDMLDKEIPTAEDYTFTIMPVDVQTESTQESYYQSAMTYTTAITPFISGASMVKLNLSKAKITLTFGKQTSN